MILNREKNFLIILTGLPASGKSYFANKLKHSFMEKPYHLKVKIVDPDIIRSEITPNKFDHEKEQTIRKFNLDEVKKALEDNFIVISDDLNYYTSMRHDLKKIADDLNKMFFIIHIATPLEVCIEWNEKRGKPIPNELIEKIAKKFDYFNNYSWETPISEYNIAKIHNLDNKIEKLVEKLIKVSKSSEIEKIQVKQAWSYNQNFDTITRKIVGKLLQYPDFMPFKNNIIKIRKRFIKINLNKALSKSEIAKSFKEYIKKELNIEIPRDTH